MKRSTFYLLQFFVFSALAIFWADGRLVLACMANFSAGRWAEITK